jgi:hypothetical protein
MVNAGSLVLDVVFMVEGVVTKFLKEGGENSLLLHRIDRQSILMNNILVAGCYERFLFGFNLPDVPYTSSSSSATTMERRFTHAAHKASLQRSA